MEIFDDVIDQVSKVIAKEFYEDVQTFTTDLAKDILLRVNKFDKREKLEILAKVMITLWAINLTRFACLFEDDCQAQIWDEMKNQSLIDSEEYRKVYYQEVHENNN